MNDMTTQEDRRAMAAVADAFGQQPISTNLTLEELEWRYVKQGVQFNESLPERALYAYDYCWALLLHVESAGPVRVSYQNPIIEGEKPMTYVLSGLGDLEGDTECPILVAWDKATSEWCIALK